MGAKKENKQAIKPTINIFEFKTVVPLQKPDIVVTGVHDFQDGRIFEIRSQEGKIKFAQRVEEVSPSTRIYLN